MLLITRISVIYSVVLLAVGCGKKIENSSTQVPKSVVSNTSVSDSKNGFSNEVLFMAIDNGDENLVKTELEHGVSPNSLLKGESPLHRAIAKKEMTITRILVEANADMAKRNANGKRPLELAMELNLEDIFIFLVSKNALAKYPDRLQLLIQAVKNRQEIMAIELIIGNTTFDIEKALYYSHKNGLNKLNQLLKDIQHYSKVNQQQLKQIVKKGDLNLLRYLGNRLDVLQLGNGANLLASCLEITNITDRHKMLEYLLDKGFNANGEAKDSINPLFTSVQNKDLNALQMLITNGAEIKIISAENQTPLTYAVKNLDFKMTEFLYSHGAQRKYRVKKNNRTYIYDACHFLRHRGGNGNYEMGINSNAYNKIFSVLTCEH